MLQSRLFTRTRREVPKDEVSRNAELLIRGGFINKEMAGVYDYLPLGLKVLNKIIGIIREEMNALGAQEIFMASLQRSELWDEHFKQGSRWNGDVWFKTKLNDGGDLGLAFTHEEPISNMLEQYVSSYKDLPFSVYQFQTKFRNEERAKNGILRTREFIMKDLYSFATDAKQHDQFYQKVRGAYERIFERAGIGDITYFTRASGGSFAKFSHEFQAISGAGEDTIYTVPGSKIAVNDEIIDEAEALEGLNVKKGDLIKEKAIEVGNIFTLGTRFSDPHLSFKNEEGQKQSVFMGSYGIGPGRLMGTIVETLSDENGIIWPKEVAPFRAHLVLASEDAKIRGIADELYKTLMKEGVDTLYDDRDLRAGEKFADSDLIGIPTRIIVGNKTAESGLFELKDRETGAVSERSLENLLQDLKK